jgi:hypothetical protein
MKELEVVAIGAVFKSEGPYILEWVAYHKRLGFSLIVADNGGDDETSALLLALHRANVIHRLDFRNMSRPQFPAYRAIIRAAARQGVDILGFMDVDEFFARSVPPATLNAEDGANYIRKLFRQSGATQYSFHWLNYGSRTSYEDNSLPCLQRFTYRSKVDEGVNVNVKSFFRLSCMQGWQALAALGPYVISSHWQYPASKSWYIYGRRVEKVDPSTQPDHSYGCILHYQIKTWPEYQNRMRRGDVAFRNNKYSEAFFQKNDFNDVATPVDPALVSELAEEIKVLEQKIHPFYCDTIPVQTRLSRIGARIAGFGLSPVDGIKHKVRVTRQRFQAKILVG